MAMLVRAAPPCLRRDKRGVAELEMACVLPILLPLALACVDWGRKNSQSIELTHAVRVGAQYAITASDSPANIVNAVKAALPVGLRDLQPTVTCHCGSLSDGGTELPSKMESCDTPCRSDCARLTRVRLSYEIQSVLLRFLEKTGGVPASLRQALTEVSADVTIRHQ